MTYLFSITLGLSAFLLFIIQPLIGKLLLPHFGGSPSVWNLCMGFFQALLLLGYIYSHWLGKLKLNYAFSIHLILLVLTTCMLPFSTIINPVGLEKEPSIHLLKWLLSNAALPFFMVSSTAPLLQKWFATSAHKKSADPYFLYVASNLGSFIALFAFPTTIEPFLPITIQNKLWSFGFLFLIILISLCKFKVVKSCSDKIDRVTIENSIHKVSTITITNWIFCAFVPSTLMLGITTHITTNIAAVPLLWIIPLALYLLSFILAFQNPQIYNPNFLKLIFPGTLLLSLSLVFLDVKGAPWLAFFAQIIFFFIVALYSHNKLANLRPNTTKLTDYYLYISLGGVLGGIFNAIIAPLIFKNILEYPLAIVASAFLIDRLKEPLFSWRKILSVLIPTVIIQILAITFFEKLAPGNSAVKLIAYFAVPAIPLYYFRTSMPIFLAGLLFIFFSLNIGFSKLSSVTVRNFYGVKKVFEDEARNLRILVHGNTEHGAQSRDSKRKLIPLTYFYPTGPVGDIFELVLAKIPSAKVGIVGLGSGAMACYSRESDNFTFYEIDPAIYTIATDISLFTYMSDCPGKRKIIIGDGRQELKKVNIDNYDLLILDAFSSDSVPVHLVTKEAIELYLEKIKSDGILLFNISNRYLNLEPVLANIANELGLNVYVRHDYGITEDEYALGKYPSSFLSMSKTVLPIDTKFKKWGIAKKNDSVGIWTDSYSSITKILN